MAYREGDRDMLVLYHEFRAEFPGKAPEHITSTMVDFGIPHGDTSMARTVSLPAAIAVKLISEGKIHARGVQIPVLPEFYSPILDELSGMGICFEEKCKNIEQ